MPNLCLKDRKVPQPAMDSDFVASAKEEADSANPTEVQTRAIIRKPREADRRVLGDFLNGRQPQHIGLSGNLRPDAERAGLRQADEGRNLPNGWRVEEGTIPNGLLLLPCSKGGAASQDQEEKRTNATCHECFQQNSPNYFIHTSLITCHPYRQIQSSKFIDRYRMGRILHL